MIELLLFNCKMSRRYRGYVFLHECIRLGLMDENKLLCMKDLYAEVANKFGVPAERVPVNIRRLIQSCERYGGLQAMENLFGVKLPGLPTVSDMIEMSVWHCIQYKKLYNSQNYYY